MNKSEQKKNFAQTVFWIQPKIQIWARSFPEK